MGESEKSIEDEVRRAAEQAKELQDSAAAFMAKTFSEEQSTRSRVVALESTIRRLHSSLNSQRRDKLLDPMLAEKVCSFARTRLISRFRSIVI